MGAAIAPAPKTMVAMQIVLAAICLIIGPPGPAAARGRRNLVDSITNESQSLHDPQSPGLADAHHEPARPQSDPAHASVARNESHRCRSVTRWRVPLAEFRLFPAPARRAGGRNPLRRWYRTPAPVRERITRATGHVHPPLRPHGGLRADPARHWHAQARDGKASRE